MTAVMTRARGDKRPVTSIEGCMQNLEEMTNVQGSDKVLKSRVNALRKLLDIFQHPQHIEISPNFKKEAQELCRLLLATDLRLGKPHGVFDNLSEEATAMLAAEEKQLN